MTPPTEPTGLREALLADVRAMNDRVPALWWQPNPLAGANAMQSAHLELRALFDRIEAALSPGPEPVAGLDVDYRAMYMSLLDSWAMLCDLAGAEGDDAPHEVINAILADPGAVQARWAALSKASEPGEGS